MQIQKRRLLDSKWKRNNFKLRLKMPKLTKSFYKVLQEKVKTKQQQLQTAADKAKQTATNNMLIFLGTIRAERNEKHNKRSIEKLASKFGIIDKTDIKELTELAIVNVCRKIANDKALSDYEKYLSILETYRNQVILSHRTSISILLQQYSTASPIAYLAGLYVKNGVQNYRGQIFEPTAGNGMMTIAFRPEQCTVNEIDDTRYKNLLTQGFRKATQIMLFITRLTRDLMESLPILHSGQLTKGIT
ncbi:hypothetical protein U1Q18_050185 [Sarracenia purpurea var. burkii]